MSKYSVILNKSMSGDLYTVAIVNIGIEIIDMYMDYNSQIRDKYDPFTFIDWMVNVYHIKSWNTSSTMFNKHSDTAYRFNFSNPVMGRKTKAKKVKIAKRIKTAKR